jgi:hypothetical protein
MTPTCQLRFVKRRVGRNVVRILQQKYLKHESDPVGEWRDVELHEDDGATPRDFPPEGH